ncbi:MAG: radical SAM protein, partial [Candidatus Omnitrophica bacterium]|nr:radical SAM protein [Candidatus Omnitrophota bacterium]
IKEQRPNVSIIAGGMACFYKEDRNGWLEQDKLIDAFVIGEGEESLSELIKQYKTYNHFRDIPGCCSLEKGYADFQARKSIQDLNHVPYPLYPGLNIEKYADSPIPLFWSRSCMGQCSFCEIRNAWKHYRERSVENIMNELRYYIENVKRYNFSVFDSVVNVNPGQLAAICDGIVKMNWHIQWDCNVVAHSKMNKCVYDKMKLAGCQVVYFGIESGSANILRRMKKPFSVAEAERNIQLAHDAGLRTSVNFITGFPGETEDDFLQTIDFASRNKTWIDCADFVTECQVARGTDLFEHPDKYDIIIPERWDGYKWCSKDGGNTVTLRQERTEQLQKKLSNLGIKVNTDYNLKDGDQSVQEAILSQLTKKRNNAPKHNDILLVTSPPWGVHNPPVGLAYLSTYLRSKGIRADVFDFNIGLYRRVDPKWHKLWLPEYKNWWSNPQKIQELVGEFSLDIAWAVERILQYDAPIIGFSVVDPKERVTIDMIRKILNKNRSKRIILGGPATSTPEQRAIFMEYIGSSLDYFVVGEGEEILSALLSDYRKRNFALSVEDEMKKPLIVQKNISDIDSIPHPTYEEFDFALYDGGSLIVEWSRGCISSCAFCKGKNLLGPFRMKSAEYIIKELAFQHAQHNVNYFVVCDNLLNGNVKELERVCDLLAERNLPIRWEGQGIPYRQMTLPLLKKMRAAGCCKIQWGLECGSDKILQNIGKGRIFTVNEAEVVIRNSHEAGIQTELFIIVGLPGENDAEFKKTEAFLRRNHTFIDRIKSINTLHLVHGTELFNHAEDYGLCFPADNWHYLWYSKDGNNDYPQRVKRARALIDLTDNLGIHVQEHNLCEGTEFEQYA